MELWCKCVSLYGAALEPLGRRRRRRLGLGVWDEELTEIVVLQVAGCRTDRAGQWQGGVLCSVLCFRFPFAWCVRAWCTCGQVCSRYGVQVEYRWCKPERGFVYVPSLVQRLGI